MIIPHTKIENDESQKIIKFYGDPLFSNITNLMIESIQGNASLLNSQVICISDAHFDPSQKYIRAKIIEEIIKQKKTRGKIIFLFEGLESEQPATQQHYARVMGENTFDCDAKAFGWENKKLHSKSMRLIHSMISLNKKNKKIVKQKKQIKHIATEILKNPSIPLEEAKQKVQIYGPPLETLRKNERDNQKIIAKELIEIFLFAEKRNVSLYATTKKVAKENPLAIICVIAGRSHLKKISEEIRDINHSILIIKCLRKIDDPVEAINGYYRKPRSSNTKSQRKKF